ncbi:4-coumarate--CoA ligase-like 7 isoform X2 [Typha angustifolia]|uniref:4-coumarate--CoA ligase-like 7 isoform X2 n=1 Tax=Typha angustifolia TaxID=59011 RepID=UPI003C307281
MAEAAPPAPSVDPRSGFCAETRTFHSLRSPPTRLPPQSLPLSFPSFLFSFLPSPLPCHPAFLDPSTHDSISFPSLLSNVRSLSFALRPKISKGDVALVVSPPRLDLPILYLSLLSLGAVVSPVNPVSTSSEISRLVELSSPSLAFATSSTAPKFPPDFPLVLLDSPYFQSLLNAESGVHIPEDEDIRQSDTAAIMYSSGTSGLVKGVALSHRNLIAQVAPLASEPATRPAPVLMITVPLFHVYGFVFCLKTVAAGETAVISSARFDAWRTLEAISRFRVTNLALAPPGVLALVGAREKEQAAKKSRSDVSSVKAASCGGAPIGTDLIRRFLAAFPHTRLAQGYGMTESTGGAFRSESPEENQRLGSVGRLVWGMEARIVDPVTGVALSPSMQGELWIRGPTIMQGYIGDDLSTSATLDSEGWLKTGDLCYIDEDGFLVLLDRLKELIKYKGYQN